MTGELNWHVGWALVLIGLLSGALIGLGFARDSFLGGYDGWRRRLIRLGHIACLMLGVANLLVSQANWYSTPDIGLNLAQISLAAGGITMPLICFLSGWKKAFRHSFALPVVLLVTSCVLFWWRASV